MPDDENGQPGWGVVRPDMRIFLVTGGAGINLLEVGLEKNAPAATRAAP